jgi:hypothetical protein
LNRISTTLGILLVVLGMTISLAIAVIRDDGCHAYAEELEGQNHELKIACLQKDIDYLSREKCKNISMRVINMNNEVKDVHFVGFGLGPGNQKTVTIVVDGQQKDFDYDALMNKVFSVECGDDFNW